MQTTLPDLFCSLEQAIKLRDQGLTTPSLFSFIQYYGDPEKYNLTVSINVHPEAHNRVEVIPTYSEEELNKLLPLYISDNKDLYILTQEMERTCQFRVYYGWIKDMAHRTDATLSSKQMFFSNPLSVRAKADCLSWLISEEFINVKDLNNNF